MMMATTGSIPIESKVTYELYLKGSSYETTKLQTADRKVLEIGKNYINVISPLFNVNFSDPDMVSIDREKGVLTYWDGALENKVNLGDVDKIKKFVEEFFFEEGEMETEYTWRKVGSEPEPKLEPKPEFKRQHENPTGDVELPEAFGDASDSIYALKNPGSTLQRTIPQFDQHQYFVAAEAYTRYDSNNSQDEIMKAMRASGAMPMAQNTFKNSKRAHLTGKSEKHEKSTWSMGRDIRAANNSFSGHTSIWGEVNSKK